MSEQQTQVPEQTPVKKIEFSPEQQNKVDELIRESMGRAGSIAKATAAQAERDAATARAEALSLKAELATLKGDKEELARVTKTIQEENIKIRTGQVIQDAAAKLGFFNPSQLAKLVGDDLKWDGAKFIVVGSDGSPRLGADGTTPLSPDSFFQEYASQNPHLVRGEVKTGVGSREMTQPPHKTLGEKEQLAKLFGRGADAVACNRLALSNPAEFKTPTVPCQALWFDLNPKSHAESRVWLSVRPGRAMCLPILFNQRGSKRHSVLFPDCVGGPHRKPHPLERSPSHDYSLQRMRQSGERRRNQHVYSLLIAVL